MTRRAKPEAGTPFVGAMAGIAATVAMTMAMDAMFRRLPPHERYPLPPRELTERVAETGRMRHGRDETEMQLATLVTHFSFGAVAGVLYALLLPLRKVPAVPNGIAYGLMVWAGSYLGWVPALGLLRTASQHPPRRNALMIAAHLVWGAVLGLSARSLARVSEPFGDGPLRDASSRDAPKISVRSP